jgi:hypothetical protein
MPVVRAAPDFFELSVAEGESLSDIGLLVYEEHGDTVVFGAEALPADGWLQLHDSIGFTPDSLYFDVHAEDLEPGVYYDSIVIFDPTGNSLWEDVYVHVMLLVEGEPPDFIVETAPTSFDVTVEMGGFVYDSLHVYEIHDRYVPFVYSNSCYWLVVFGHGGPLDFTPTSFVVLIDSDTLSVGTYRDTIFISPASDSLDFPIVAVPVTMNVGTGFVCGDVDGSGRIDIDDIVWMVLYVFYGGYAPAPIGLADVDCSGGIDIDDIVYMIDYVFALGPYPCADCR